MRRVDGAQQAGTRAGTEGTAQRERALLYCLVVDGMGRGVWSFWFLAALCNSMGSPVRVCCSHLVIFGSLGLQSR